MYSWSFLDSSQLITNSSFLCCGDSSTALLLWRMRMRLMNVDQANSSVLARPQPIKYAYIQTCMDEMVCSNMAVFIALLRYWIRIKAHTAVSFFSNWDNGFQVLKSGNVYLYFISVIALGKPKQRYSMPACNTFS